MAGGNFHNGVGVAHVPIGMTFMVPIIVPQTASMPPGGSPVSQTAGMPPGGSPVQNQDDQTGETHQTDVNPNDHLRLGLDGQMGGTSVQDTDDDNDSEMPDSAGSVNEGSEHHVLPDELTITDFGPVLCLDQIDDDPDV
jgi:hypothetical protein